MTGMLEKMARSEPSEEWDEGEMLFTVAETQRMTERLDAILAEGEGR